MTTQYTEHEHNEEHGTNAANVVDEGVVAEQHTSDRTLSAGTTSSSDETSSETHASAAEDTPSETAAPETEQHSASEEVAATLAFAEETGNTIPELSSLVPVEDLQASAQQEETGAAQDSTSTSTHSAEDIPAQVQEEVVSPAADQVVNEQAEEVHAASAGSVEHNQEQAAAKETGPTVEQVSSVEQTGQTPPQEVDAVAAPVFLMESETVTAETTPQVIEEIVRSFEDFVEEFQQAQAEAEAQAEADITASFGGVQAEAFSEFAAPEVDATAVDQPITLEEALPPVDFGEGSAFVPGADVTPVDSAEVNVPVPAETATIEENQRVEAVKEMGRGEEAAPVVQQQTERPVSPLLRPAMRPRPRHGATRHRDEFAASNAGAVSAEPSTTGETPQTTGTTQDAAGDAEQPKEVAKPPRRYRFDRPARQAAQSAQQGQATTAGSKPATPVQANNGSALTPPPATQPTPSFARVEESSVVKNASVSAPATGEEEQQGGELIGTENSGVTATEQGRRRNGGERPVRQEREKEQNVAAPVVAPASVSEIAAALVSETNAEDVAPEDLPPLEYSELQKASSSRRRRRHRATPSTGTPIAKESVTSTNGAQQSAPLAPAAPVTSTPPNGIVDKQAAASASYSITSGFTVGQMNQGNEESGPFMGPEPSPARGSVNTTRDGRTVRVESQPQRTSMYQTRAVDGMLPAAAMNHFANIVSQAIQTQSDRMVAELRRANQAPTNVSVSLPPFPSNERVGVFVDVANLLYSARTQRIAIDFGKLLDFLRGNRRLVRAHAYCPTSPQPGDEQMFLTAVKGLGYRITTKNYKTFASGAKKADLDLDLCMDVVRLVDGGAVDVIVLVSGDSDFMPMLDYCSDHGVRVEVAAFDEAMSATLRQSCDLFINLSMLEEVRA